MDKNRKTTVVRDLTESLGKMPPAALDMEESVLGALLMEKNAIIEVAGFLRSDHFYSDAHSEIYKAIVTLFSHGDPIDMRTVVGQLRKTGKLELVGGAYAIAELTSKLSSAAHVEFHARVIVEMSMKRSLIQLASMVHQEAYEDTADVFDLIEKANLDLQSVLDNALNATSEKSLKDISVAVVKEQQERQTGKHDGLNTGFSVIDKMLSGFRKTDLIVIAARPGMGKALGLDELLLTPNGWIQMKSVKLGDKVAGSDGRFYDVTGVYPQGIRETFKVILDDHTSIVCDAEHLWTTQTRKERKACSKGSVKTTEEIKQTLASYDGRKNHSICYHRPIVYNKKETLIDPYLYGLLIGDGGLTNSSVRFSNPEKDILSEVHKLLPSDYLLKEGSDGLNHSIIKVKKTKGCSFFDYIPNLKGKYSYERSIDESYLYNSIDSRLSLLQGLLDTDGTVVARNPTWIEFSTSSPKLCDQVVDLVRGLGGRATFKTRMGRYENIETRKTFRIYIGFSNGIVPVASKKHLSKFKQKQFGKKFIVDIIPNGRQEVQCIKVNSPDSLFVTTGNTLTHNTAIIVQAAMNIAKQGHPIGMFSLEMGANQLVQRAAVSETEIDSESVKKGILRESEFVRFMHACGDLGKLPFYIDDTAFMSIIELRARAMRMKSKYGIKLLIIDYLQLIKGLSDSGKTTNNRDQEIGIITRTLKGMAKELDIPVVALSQLNRSVETRGGSKRPLLSDLRESGCLTGDSLIYCPRLKKNVRIRELIHRNNFNILAFNGKNNKPMNAKKCWSTGVKSVFNISLLTGHSLQATANHKFMSVNGWRALKDFSDKDLLAIPINYSQEYTRKIPDSEVRLIGHFLSNGSCLKGQPIRYTCNTLDQDLSDSVISDAIASVGQVAPYKKEYNVKSIWTTVYFKPTFHLTHGKTSPVADLMRKYCLFDVRSKEKFIPDSFFFLPTSQIQELLKALFSGDGCAYYRESKGRKTLSISFSSASHELTKGVQSLLQSIGIVSKIDALKNAKGHSWYNLSITGMSNIEIFVRDVGFIQERKQQIMLDGWERYKSVIPGWTKVQYNEHRTLAFIPITSITPIGKKRVYDIEVPGDHSFMANGILAHNSIEQDADIVMFLYRPEYYKITQDENGNSTHGQCEVIIEKHRGGSTGTVLLKFIGKFTKFSEWIYYDNKPDYVGQQKSPLPKEGDAPIPFNDDNPF